MNALLDRYLKFNCSFYLLTIYAFIQLFEENIQRNLDAAPVVRQKDNSKIGQRTRPYSSIINESEAELDLNKENSLKHVQVKMSSKKFEATRWPPECNFFFKTTDFVTLSPKYCGFPRNSFLYDI